MSHDLALIEAKERALLRRLEAERNRPVPPPPGVPGEVLDPARNRALLEAAIGAGRRRRAD